MSPLCHQIKSHNLVTRILLTVNYLHPLSPDAHLISLKTFKKIFMNSVLNVEVSCFRSYSGKEPKSINLLTWLQSEKYKEEILQLRSLQNKEELDQIKASLPAITVSGTFYPTRKAENLVKHSGLICIDIDPKGNEHISNYLELREELIKIENVAYAGLSASGKGFFLIIPIAMPKRHKQHFQALQEDFQRLGLEIDTAPQNVVSLRGYSYDTEAFFRHDATPFKRWKNPAAIEKKKYRSHSFSQQHTPIQERVEKLILQLQEKQIDITQEEGTWWRLACALANEFGEQGRSYFHAISQFHPGYKARKANRKYTYALKGKYKQITIGTFFSKAQEILQNIP